MSVHTCHSDAIPIAFFTYSDKFHNSSLLINSSCDGCMYSLTKSEAKYKEMKDTKERENVVLRDDLAQIQRRYVCMFVSFHTRHIDTIPIMITLYIIIIWANFLKWNFS